MKDKVELSALHGGILCIENVLINKIREGQGRKKKMFSVLFIGSKLGGM